MTLSSRPLLDNAADATLFVGRRREFGQLECALQAQLNVLLVGESGSGKTSLLRQEMYRLRGGLGATGDYATTYVRAEGIADARALLAEIARALFGAAPDGSATDLLHAIGGEVDEQSRSGIVRVLFVDDVSAAAGHGLFGRLRDELWSLGCVWVVATRDRAGVLVPPADAFFERVIELGPLTPDDAVALFRARRGVGGNWPAQLSRAVDGNPRRMLALARDHIIGETDLSSLVDSLATRDAAIARLGRSESMLANGLDALGAASASDNALLDRLGWTRSRAVQVLQRLEGAGLVRSDDVKSGPGRPRKVFRLTSPKEYADWLHMSEAAE